VAGVWTSESVWWRVVAVAGLTAAGVYLLDRVKARDAWLDPADREAHPTRFEFLSGRSGWVRGLMVVLLVAAVVLGWSLTGWVAAGVVAAVAGVWVYAGRPRAGRARVKDVLLLKNAFVAGGIAGFAGVMVVIAACGGGPGAWWVWAGAHAGAMVVACGTLAVRVFADAALCDLDDERSDRAHGTVTLPTVLGRRRAWLTAMTLRLISAAALWLSAGGQAAPRAWAVVTVVSTIGLWLYQPARLRDLVDARFGAEAGVVLAVLTV
jgi:4-hydroxybenzoate polyprenyltransferase